MKQYPLRKVSMVAAIVTLTSSCTTMHQAGQDYGTAIGCVGGAALGGGLTYLLTGDAKKALAGGLIGGVAGCAAGNIWQNREKALAKIAAEENIAIQTRTLEAQAKSSKQAVGLVAQVQDKGMFDTNSAQLSADGLRQVRKLAAAMKEGDQGGVILVVGHTDATGNPQLNQRLSEQRAQNVGRVLEQAGLSSKNLYFQGAGSSRPVADNASAEGRAANRRVELAALASEALLKQRLEQEGSNLAYLRYSTTSENTPPASARAASPKRSGTAKKTASTPASQTSTSRPATAAASADTPAASAPQVQTASGPAAIVDFGGQPVSSSTATIAASLKPRSSGFSLISEANASSVMKSCYNDNARIGGQAKNLASGRAVETSATKNYLPGMNGRAWAGLVNGHLVTLSPVRVLSDNATVTENPKVYITRDYQAKHNRKVDAPLSAVANAWEGEDSILYRVYLQNEKQQALSCIDLLVPKASKKAQQGQLYYSNHNSPYQAAYAPVGL
ncbi:OmpA family protein [Erwinia sp. Eh17-17]|uniref:OmpA family protein n=1 Tax=Erwinia sp. Eh17-17 TaxID=3080330 RepID=UPI00320970DF